MPRLTTPYSSGTPVLMLRVGTSAESAVFLNGIVDSGADRTLLPREMAPDMGIEQDALLPSPGSNTGAGGTSFPTWTPPSETVVTGQVVAFTPDATLWGPEITLNPQFADDTTTLYGRADFFQSFVVTFFRDPNLGEVFTLDY